MTTGYQWAKRTKTQQLITELDLQPPGWRSPKRNKYGAKKQIVDGITFDSKREAQVYGELKLREKAGEIRALDVHPQYNLAVNGEPIAKYKPDFRFLDLQVSVWGRRLRVIDVKSPPTAKKRDFVLIRKLMKAIHDIDVEVVT